MSYFQSHQDHVFALFVQHLQLSCTALGFALLIALPLGILISRYPALYGPVLGVFGVIYTIPSLALLALLVSYIGIGTLPALIALVAYAQFILIRNIVAGLQGVDPAVIEAARGMGMSPGQVLWRIELPLALPIIIAGLRIATVATIGIATIAAFVDAGGLGSILYEGVQQNYNAEIEAGAMASALLALLADLVLRLVEWTAGRRTGGPQAAPTTQR